MSANDLATVLEDNQRLRIENDQIRKERDAARRERDLAILLNEIDETGRLRIENAWHSERDEARRERDEARREVCKARAAISRNSWAAQAKKAGWDKLWEET